MKNVKKGEDNFVEFDNFDEVKEVFEEAMKIVEDEDGERFLVIENKEDLEKFRKMLFDAYYELHPEESNEHNMSQKPKSSK
jgi:hypothetical protein